MRKSNAKKSIFLTATMRVTYSCVVVGAYGKLQYNFFTFGSLLFKYSYVMMIYINWMNQKNKYTSSTTFQYNRWKAWQHDMLFPSTDNCTL